MSTTHSGNIANEITREEHDGSNNAKRVNVVAGGVGQATITLAPSPSFVGIVTIANPSSFTGNITLDPGSRTGIVGNITLSDSKGFIGLTTAVNGQAWPDPKTYIGLATIDIGTNNSVGLKGNVTISDSKAFIGLTTTVVGSSLPAGANFIGLVTIVGSLSAAAGNVTLDAGSKTGIVGNVTLSDSKGFIGLVTIGGIGTVTLADPKGFIGLVTVVQASTTRSLLGNLTLSDSKGFIGLVTTVYSPPPISTYTSFATVFSATGNASLFAPPSGKRFVIKDLHVSSLGRAEIRIMSDLKELIPYTSLSTTAGFFEHYGEAGLAAEGADQIFAINLNGAATISIMANVRFE